MRIMKKALKSLLVLLMAFLLAGTQFSGVMAYNGNPQEEKPIETNWKYKEALWFEQEDGSYIAMAVFYSDTNGWYIERMIGMPIVDVNNTLLVGGTIYTAKLTAAQSLDGEEHVESFRARNKIKPIPLPDELINRKEVIVGPIEKKLP